MMKKSVLNVLTFLLLVTGLPLSCDVELKKPEVDEVVAEEGALANRVIYDVVYSFNTAIAQRVGTKKSDSNCPSIEDPYNSENSIKITYPEEGCEQNGITKSGSIIVSFSSDWEIGSSATITFDNFTIDENSIDGTITITFSQMIPYPVFEIEASSMVITLEDGETYTWSADKTFTMLEGFLTLDDISDDVWQISGTTNGTSSNGKNFSSVETNLLTSQDCRWFVGGKTEITVNEDTFEATFGPECGVITYKYEGISINGTLE